MVVSWIWFGQIGVAIDRGSTLEYLRDVLAVGAAAGIMAVLPVRKLQRVNAVVPRLVDALASVAQSMMLILSFTMLTYCAAGAGRPLVDEPLAAIDGWLGFDWQSFEHWVAERATLHAVLLAAYVSPAQQAMVLIFLNSWRTPGARNADLVWPTILCLAIDSFCLAVMPAQSMDVQPGYLQDLYGLRSGAFTRFAIDHATGLVSFPSYHASMAVTFIYFSRRLGWLFPIFLTLNLLMLVSTVPIGGHYLVDVIAGVAVAGAAIYMTRRIVPASRPGRWAPWLLPTAEEPAAPSLLVPGAPETVAKQTSTGVA